VLLLGKLIVKGSHMKYSLRFRIWHWLNAFVVLGLLGTVFLRKTFLSWRTNSEILMSKLAEINIDIAQEEAKILAKAVRAGMWEWHILLGYALAFLMLYRVALFFFDSSQKESFSSLILHKKMVHISYYILYAILFFMSISGLVIYFYEALSLSKDTAHEIKEMHEFLYNYILIFVPLHLGGVVVAESRGESGIISRMIHGRE
jgi:cytochrome b561